MDFNFTPGEEVVLVDDNWPPESCLLLEFGFKYPVRRTVYTVRLATIRAGVPGILLEEINNSHRLNMLKEEIGFASRRFRRLSEMIPADHDQAIEQLLQQSKTGALFPEADYLERV